ncbi:hypothetical protein Taro_014522 [Colocasia esculenta]|uniref:PISTILLATA-like protein n=1 Tax=Colocasia esculenta TaxID=4460 RepID=A0A843UF62_COLES|nr:hypothetical protein [Colocasia esculenta]
MGRGKVEIKRIENATNRQVTYSKRKNGIIKKAREISVLCNARVCLVIFSSAGKMIEFCSDSTTLPSMLEEYQKHTGRRMWDAKHEGLNAEIDRVKKENDNLLIELRHLKGEDITPMSPFELIPLEETLERGLSSVREKQMEYLKKLRETGRKLEDEKRHLNLFLGEIAMNGADATELPSEPFVFAATGGNRHEWSRSTEVDRHYQENESNCPAPMPFSFLGQPIQLDLQNSK